MILDKRNHRWLYSSLLSLTEGLSHISIEILQHMVYRQSKEDGWTSHKFNKIEVFTYSQFTTQQESTMLDYFRFFFDKKKRKGTRKSFVQKIYCLKHLNEKFRKREMYF